jgi:parallel beta-helix repeat protein
MNVRQKIVLIMSIAIICSIFFGLIMLKPSSIPTGTPHQNETMTSPTTIESPIITHPAIEILSNKDFSRQGWPGIGSTEDPYIIEGLTIAKGSPRIKIQSVNVHFIIRNCVLLHYTFRPMYGIHLENVTHAKIENCSILLSCTSSIYLTESNGCTIRDNEIVNASFSSVNLYESDNCILQDNKIHNQGIRLSELRNCSIINNSLTTGGLVLSNAVDCKLINNTISAEGIWIDGDSPKAWNHQLSNNQIMNIPIGYFKNLTNQKINLQNYSQVILTTSQNITAYDAQIERVAFAISVAFCTNCSIKASIVRHAQWGIRVESSDNIILLQNIVYNSSVFGIELDDSQNCIIRENTVSYGLVYDLQQGLRVDSSTNCVIQLNTVYGNGYGIFVVESEFCMFENNTIYNNRDSGIMIYRSTDCHMKGSTIYDNFDGVHILASDRCTISHCNLSENDRCGISVYHADFLYFNNNTIVENNHHGINLDLSYNTTIIDNSISGNRRYGILIVDATEVVILRNNASSNNDSGICLRASDYCNIISNYVCKNTDVGIKIDINSSDNILFGNGIGWNIESNAIDDGVNNYWDDSISQGNAWSDYSGLDVYLIPGDAESVDRFPSILVEC